MSAIRKRRIYQNAAHHPQENLTDYVRTAYVNTVNVEAGTCTLYFLDGPGGRSDVALSQGSWGEYNMPIPGAIVLVMFDRHDQARIVRYSNLNQFFDQKTRSEGGNSIVLKLKAGDKFWRSSGDAYLYLSSLGRVVMSDSEGDVIEIDPDSNLLKTQSVNWKVVSNAGTDYSGDVKRPGTDGTIRTVTDGVPTQSFPDGTPLEERTTVANDFDPNSLSGEVTVKVSAGNVVNDSGKVSDKNGVPTTPHSTTAVAYQVDVVKAGTTVGTILIDKAGNMVLDPKASGIVYVGSPSATEPAALGQQLHDVIDDLITAIKQITVGGVTTGPGFSGPPANVAAFTAIASRLTTILSRNVKLT